MNISDYGSLKGCALPGSISDSGDYNIDGSCVVHADDQLIECGKVVHVKRIEDGYKEISCRFSYAGDVPYGVVAYSANDVTGKYDGNYCYHSGDVSPVISHGRAWLLTYDLAVRPTFGAHVKINQRGEPSTVGSVIGGWSYTGGFERVTSLMNIVEVQIIQSGMHMSGGVGIKVNGIHMTSDLPSPQKHGTSVVISAAVSPANATNPIGEWFLAQTTNATLTRIDDFNYRLTPKAGFVGKVHVTWHAQDGSGVQGMIEFEFTA